MSNAAITWVLGNRRNEPGLRGPKNAQRLVLLVLANYASDDGESFPGIDTIAAEANLTKGTAKSALTWLIEHGYLERDVKAGPPRRGARQPRNIYRLIWTAEQEGTNSDPSPPEQEGMNFDDKRGGNSDARGAEIPTSDAITPISVNPMEPKGEPADSQASSACALTVNQRAQTIQRAYWSWVHDRTGHNPVTSPVGMQRMIAKLLGAGRADRDVKVAMAALYERGRPIVAQTIEAQIDGRGGLPPARKSLDEQLAGIEYDDRGMIVG